MKNESIGIIAWDTSGNNNWARPATLNTYLNGTYYNELNTTAQSQIVVKDWSIGAVTSYNNDLAAQVNDENSTTWNGKVALPTLSEYIRSNSNKGNCGTYDLYMDNYSNCISTTWMFKLNVVEWWTLSPGDGVIYRITANQNIGGYMPNVKSLIRPTLYLSSDIKITGGTGTSSDPYEISL